MTNNDTRRALLRTIAFAPLSVMALNSTVCAEPVRPASAERKLRHSRIRFVDLTHQLTRRFNFTPDRIRFEPIVGSGAAVGMRLNELHLVEHTGTHLDAPSHFDVAGKTVGDIPIEDLITPLVVIDIRPRVEVDRNAALIPEDVERWERKRGRLPEGCCIALNAGWDPLASGMVPSQANRAHPGFGAEVATMLIERRSVKGIAVESMSLETGSNTTANPVHSLWLRSGRWGIEGITNLGAVPSDGALLVAGVAPIEGATGFPIRAIAVF